MTAPYGSRSGPSSADPEPTLGAALGDVAAELRRGAAREVEREARSGAAGLVLIGVLLPVGIVVVFVAAIFAFVLSMAAAAILELVGAPRSVIGIAILVVIGGGTIGPAALAMLWVYGRLRARLRRLDSPDEDHVSQQIPSGGAVGAHAPSLAAPDARSASTRGLDVSTALSPVVRGVAATVGFALGAAFAYGDGLLVGDGPIWLAELPLLVGGVGAFWVSIRHRSKPVASAAKGFFSACALFALLYLGAG